MNLEETVNAEQVVVVGVDGSRSATTALRWAVDYTRRRMAPLRVAHAWEIPANQVMEAAVSEELFQTAATDARARATSWVLDALGAAARAHPWSLDVVEGQPGPVLVERSRDAALAPEKCRRGPRPGGPRQQTGCGLTESGDARR